MYAVKMNFVEIVKALIEAKSDISIVDNSGNKALFYAEKSNNHTIIKLLKNAELKLK